MKKSILNFKLVMAICFVAIILTLIFVRQFAGKASTASSIWVEADQSVADNIPTYFMSYLSTGDEGVRFVDVNGDGLTDIVKANSGGQITYLNNGDGTDWTESDTWRLPTSVVWIYGRDIGVRLMDINGDNMVDVLRSDVNDYKKVYINNGNGWDDETASWDIPVTFSDSFLRDNGTQFADVNGDGLLDIIVSTQYFYDNSSPIDQRVFINNGTGWTEDSNYTIPVLFCYFFQGKKYNKGAKLADVNGDGLVDIIQYPKTYINKGDNTGWEDFGTFESPVSFATGLQKEMYQLIDINGDGLVDIVSAILNNYQPTVNTTVYINDGSGWHDESEKWSFPLYFQDPSLKDAGVYLVDINGDNLPDIIRSLYSRRENTPGHVEFYYTKNIYFNQSL